MVTLIYMFLLSNYLRERINEALDLLGLNRFGSLQGGPGATFETQGRLFGDLFVGIGRGGCIFGIFELGMSFVHFTFEFCSSISRFRFTFGMRTSS